VRLRVAALRRSDRHAEHGADHVDAVLRSSVTDFAVDHFRASIHASAVSPPSRIGIPASVVADGGEAYGPLFFHTGRFRRVRSYRLLSAMECIAELAAREDSWFHRYAPSPLLLG